MGKGKKRNSRPSESDALDDAARTMENPGLNVGAPDWSAQLEERLAQHSDYFDGKLSLIPAKHYFAPDERQGKATLASQDVTQQQQKKVKVTDVEVVVPRLKPGKKAASKEVLRKFDPLYRRNVADVINSGAIRIAPKEEEDLYVQPEEESDGDEEMDEAIDLNGDDMDDDDLTAGPGLLINRYSAEMEAKLGFKPGSKAETPSELKRRMALVREFLKKKERGEEDNNNNNNNNNNEGEDEEARKAKRELNRAKKAKYKLKLKAKEAERRKREREEKRGQQQAAAGDDRKNAGAGESGDEANGSKKQRQPAAPAAVDTSGLDFGQFSFGSDRLTSNAPLNQRKHAPLDVLLKKAEAEKKQEEELRHTEQGREILHDKQWEKAFAKAEGAKLKDDPKLLRKTLKRKEKKKKKSASEWADRIKTVDEGKKQRQLDYLKRQEKNILRKKKGPKRDGGGGGGQRKARAGFEGRKKKLN